jgi:hypothetical protein
MNSLLEGAALDTSAPIARGYDYRPSTSETPIMREELAVATHAGVTPIEHR